MGKRLGRRNLSNAAKMVRKYVERWNMGQGGKLDGLNYSLRKKWPKAEEIYDSADESKIPADNTWDYSIDSECV